MHLEDLLEGQPLFIDLSGQLIEGLSSGIQTMNWFRRPDEKELGNASFKEKKLDDAIMHYTYGLEQCQGTSQTAERARLLANRSAALVGVELYREALLDAEEAARLAPEWPKGWARKGKALTCLQKHKLAAAAYARGLEAALKALEAAETSHGKELEAMKRQAESSSDMYLKLLGEHETLRAQLEDYELMFAGADAVKAKVG